MNESWIGVYVAPNNANQDIIAMLFNNKWSPAISYARVFAFSPGTHLGKVDRVSFFSIKRFVNRVTWRVRSGSGSFWPFGVRHFLSEVGTTWQVNEEKVISIVSTTPWGQPPWVCNFVCDLPSSSGFAPIQYRVEYLKHLLKMGQMVTRFSSRLTHVTTPVILLEKKDTFYFFKYSPLTL